MSQIVFAADTSAFGIAVSGSCDCPGVTKFTHQMSSSPIFSAIQSSESNLNWADNLDGDCLLSTDTSIIVD